MRRGARSQLSRVSLVCAFMTCAVAACGGKTAPAEPACETPNDDAGIPLSIDGVALNARSVAAVVDDAGDAAALDALVAVLISTSTDACRDALAFAESGKLTNVFMLVGIFGPDLSALPVTLPLDPAFRSRTAEALLWPACPAEGRGENPAGGTLTITAFDPSTRIVGTLDAVLTSGKHVTLPIDTCICTTSAPCSTKY